MHQFTFYAFAVLAVLGAALCITRRSPVASLIWLMSTMFSLAAIFVLLRSELIGILQVLVYVGAILVLFLFVVMLLNLDQAGRDMRGPAGVATALTIGGLLLIELLAIWRYTPARIIEEIAQAPQRAADIQAAFPAGQQALVAAGERGIVGAVAAPMFQTYLVPFEITSVLLLAALVGAVVLAKRRI